MKEPPILGTNGTFTVQALPPPDFLGSTLFDAVEAMRFDFPVFLDNTLFYVPVPHYRPGRTNRAAYAAQWLNGVLDANDLQLETNDDGSLIVKGNDHFDVATVESPLPSGFHAAASALGWVVVPYQGRTLIQYPIVHRRILKEMLRNKPYQTRVKLWIVTHDETFERETGLNVEAVATMAATLMRESVGSLPSVSARALTSSLGVTIEVTPERTEYLLARTVEQELIQLVGGTSSVQVVTSYPYQQVTRDPQGNVSAQQVDSIEAGLSLVMSSAWVGPELIAYTFNASQGAIVGTTEDSLPITTRQVTASTVVLRRMGTASGGVEAFFLSEASSEESRTGWLFPRKVKANRKKTTVVLVARTE